MEVDQRADGLPPWAVAFEPSARAVGAIGRRGLDAATALVERVVARHESAPAGPLEHVPTVADLGELGADLFQQAWRLVAGMASVAQVDEPTADVLHLEAGAWADVRGTVWLHNTTDAAVGELRPLLTQLVDPRGTVLDVDVHLTPERVPQLGAGSSIPVQVRLVADRHHPARGTYRGLMLIGGLPDQWLVVELVVAS